MEDSIINIDDESDSFSLSSDTDVRNIVDQWKRNHTSTDQKDLKYVDTRTFTRPKKKLFTCPDVNSTYAERRDQTQYDDLAEEATTSSNSAPVPKIDLKIGGLVTSLQRSMLGDVSPPSNMDNSMGNSLITSNDFSNIDFINDTGDSLSMANFKEYRLSDAIKDRNFLERLTNYDESLFTKDADINNVDLNENGNCTGSSNSTLQNSTDSRTSLSGKNDGTFIAPTKDLVNGTFNASAEVDKTFIQAPSVNKSIKNDTFELGTKVNETFEAKPTVANTTVNIVPELLLQDEEMSLCDSFNVTKNLDHRRSDVTANLSNQFLPETGSPRLDFNSTFQLDEYQSTPAAQTRKPRKSDTLATISPIFSEKHTANNLTQNVDKFVDVEIEDIESVFLRDSAPKSTMRASNPTGIDTELREKERQSLAKFEAFENTLLILENNKSEEEFDDLLNSFSSNIRNPISDKVRQSLDSLKKRHSLVGVEKQQQDEMNHEKTMNTSKYGKYSDNGAQEKNRLNDSFGRTAMTSSMSSSGERLLRRSRLFDDVILTDRITDNSDGYPTMVIDNRQAVDLDTTQTLNRKNQQHLEKEPTSKTNNTMYNTDEASIEQNKANNRDRFKTIRIFKKPPENAVQVPDPEEKYTQEMQSPTPTPRTGDMFATKNTNSPQQQELNENHSQGSKKAINTMTFKRSGLARPRQISGLAKRDLYAKSNSQEMLSSNEQLSQTQSKPVSQLKSPMGIKSKSIHNLLSVKSTMKPVDGHSAVTGNDQPSTRNQSLSSHTFKMPAPKSVVTMRQRADASQPRKLTLIRPSSGYYGYNTKRTDSDTDLGRFSSNNSLSSGSSKSSLSRGETPESFSTANENANATFVQPPVKTGTTVPSRSAANGASGIVPPKVSLLRPPNQIRRSALPRPSALPITKR